MLFENGQLVFCVNHPHYPDFSAKVVHGVPETAEGEGHEYRLMGSVGTLCVPEAYICAQKPVTLTPSMIDEVKVTPAFALIMSPCLIQLFLRVKTPVDELIFSQMCQYFAEEPYEDGRQVNQVTQAPNSTISAYRGPLPFVRKGFFDVIGHKDSLRYASSADLRRQQAFIHNDKHIAGLVAKKLGYESRQLIQHPALKDALDVAMANEFLSGSRIATSNY